jgi:hypothetical protein
MMEKDRIDELKVLCKKAKTVAEIPGVDNYPAYTALKFTISNAAPELIAEVEKQAATIAKLKAALEQIRNKQVYFLATSGGVPVAVLTMMRDVAATIRVALEKGE